MIHTVEYVIQTISRITWIGDHPVFEICITPLRLIDAMPITLVQDVKRD